MECLGEPQLAEHEGENCLPERDSTTIFLPGYVLGQASELDMDDPPEVPGQPERAQEVGWSDQADEARDVKAGEAGKAE